MHVHERVGDLKSAFALFRHTALKKGSHGEEELAVVGEAGSRPQLQARHLYMNHHHEAICVLVHPCVSDGGLRLPQPECRLHMLLMNFFIALGNQLAELLRLTL